MRKVSSIVLSTLTAAFLVGCGGGGGSSSTPSGTPATNVTYSGSVIDGYIYGATVCLDLSLDGVCDNSEPQAKTAANGSYSFVITPEQQASANFNIAPVIAYGGTDNDTGALFTGILQSQVNGTTANVTPLTTVLSTLVQEEVKNNVTISKTDLEKKITEKKELVRTAFGLPSGTNIEDDFIKKGNLDLTRSALQIQKTVDLIAQVGSDGTVIDTTVLAKNIFDAIKEKVKVANTSTSTTDSILTQTLTATISGVATTTEVKTKLEVGQSDIKTIISNISSLNDVSSYVSLIEDRKTEIKSTTDINTLEKKTSADIPSGDSLSILALQNFLQVIGVQVNTAESIAPELIKDGVTKSNIIEKFTSTGDTTNEALQTKYSKLKAVVDNYVANLKEQATLKSYAVQAIEILDKMNIETDNVNDKINAAKAKVAGLTASDAIMVRNVLDLTNIFESDTVKNLVEVKVNGTTDVLTTGKIIKSTVKDTITFSPKFNNITSNSRTIMHDLATQLKTISDSVGTVFTNKDYVFAYGSEQITYNDSLAVRGAILAIAFKLDFLASYSWGDDEDIKTNTYAANNWTYEYQNIAVDPASVLNRGSFFKFDSSARLEKAKAYLIEGLELVNTLPSNYKDTKESDRTELTNILNSVKGNGTYELVDTQDNYNWDFAAYQSNPNNYTGTWTTTTEKYNVDLSKLLNSSYAIDVTSFGSNFEMTCKTGFTYNLTMSKMRNSAECSNNSSYWNSGASFNPTTVATASTSKLDDVVTKIVDKDGKELTGQSVIDYIMN